MITIEEINEDKLEISLVECGIDESQAFELKSKLSSIANDWNDSEPDIYDVD
jgi:hypothetical protein